MASSCGCRGVASRASGRVGGCSPREVVSHRELSDELEGELGARAAALVDAGLAELAARALDGLRLAPGGVLVDVPPLADWVERLVRGRSAERTPALRADDAARQGRLVRWSFELLVGLHLMRVRLGAVDPVDAARVDSLVLPLAELFRAPVLRKGAFCLSRDGRRFTFAGAAAGEVPDDLPLRALERAVQGVARCEPRRAFVELSCAADGETLAAVRRCVLTGLDLLRDEGALMPEGPRPCALEAIDLARSGGRGGSWSRGRGTPRVADRLEADGRRAPRDADAAALEPCPLGAADLRSFVEAEWPHATPAARERLTVGLVRALRRRAAKVLRALQSAPDGRFEARALDLLSLLDRSTISEVSGVPIGTLRGDFARSDPDAPDGPARWFPDPHQPSRPLPRNLRELLPRRLRGRFTNRFARIYPLVRFTLLPQPHEVRVLAQSLEHLLALERLFFYPASWDERSEGAPSWSVEALHDACLDAVVADVPALVRDVLLPFLIDLVRARASHA
jgi:hypothetical protein